MATTLVFHWGTLRQTSFWATEWKIATSPPGFVDCFIQSGAPVPWLSWYKVNSQFTMVDGWNIYKLSTILSGIYKPTNITGGAPPIFLIPKAWKFNRASSISLSTSTATVSLHNVLKCFIVGVELLTYVYNSTLYTHCKHFIMCGLLLLQNNRGIAKLESLSESL